MSNIQGKRIFMTGASGYIGSRITEFAIAQGYKVHGLSRSEANDEKLRKLGAVPVRGDLTTLDVLRRESAKADIVINLASAFTIASPSYESVMPIDNAALDAMADGLEGSGKPLVTTGGTLFVEPDPDGGETDESAPENQKMKNRRSENAKHALSLTKRGVCVTNVRLAPYVYGRGGSGVALFMKMAAQQGGLTTVDGGKQNVTTVHVDDAARLYLLVAEKGRSGEAYNASGENHLTTRELYEAMAAEINVPVRDISLEEAEKTMGPMVAAFLAGDGRASNAKARRELGWVPREVGVLEDIKHGSYQAVAEAIKADK